MKLLLCAATALATLSGVAYAQSNSNSGSNSNATVNTASGSQSTSVSNPRVNVIGNPIGNGASSSNSGARAVSDTRSAARSAAIGNSTTVNVEGYTGIGRLWRRPVRHGSHRAVYRLWRQLHRAQHAGGDPARIVGGNACAVGASGGLSMAGFGIAAGATWADRACERRQQAALLFNMGEQKVAVELMCQDDNVRSAMRLAASRVRLTLRRRRHRQQPRRRRRRSRGPRNHIGADRAGGGAGSRRTQA